MIPGRAFSVQLLPHPDSLSVLPSSYRIAVTGSREGEKLHLLYRLTGDMEALLWRAEAEDPDRLWAHTCFEIFLREQGSQAYCEYNFSPSGEWAGYAFSAYRQRMETPCHLPAPIVCTGRRTQDGAELEARLPLDGLASANLPFHAALATVLEFSDGRLAYYALHHPAGQADFHHADSFILPLPSSPNLT